ncbi:MAG: hypothetical protein ACYCS8_07675 [Acidithiobacillus sp.]|jgi:hypothetical protein|uniref:hypothetical protein n=1 Tax=Acidithiobacillus ferrooxidans TaxID=920 RepID=UPI0013D5D0CB|nr:hypothetical protein [Acidithiobacillus ferrooxidans]
MILAFIIIAMLIGLVAIGNTEYKDVTKCVASLDMSAPANTHTTNPTPRNSARPNRHSSPAKSRGVRGQRTHAQSPASSDSSGFVELPEEAYEYQGLDLGGMPMYDNSVSDDRFLNDPDDGMSKDSTGFDEDY